MSVKVTYKGDPEWDEKRRKEIELMPSNNDKKCPNCGNYTTTYGGTINDDRTVKYFWNRTESYYELGCPRCGCRWQAGHKTTMIEHPISTMIFEEFPALKWVLWFFGIMLVYSILYQAFT